MTSSSIAILPSLLAADTGRLADEARRAEKSGADALHLDIMDGHFVPNISFGPDVVAMARRTVRLPLNVHLMLSRPDLYVERFAKAGADTIQIHVESECDVADTLRRIRALGVRPAIVVNPETPAEALAPFLALADEVLCMTVHPGYGGQAFMEEVLPKIGRVSAMIREAGRDGEVPVMVDGGIGRETIGRCAEAGARSFVAGSALFRAPDMTTEVAALRRIAQEGCSFPAAGNGLGMALR